MSKARSSNLSLSLPRFLALVLALAMPTYGVAEEKQQPTGLNGWGRP